MIAIKYISQKIHELNTYSTHRSLKTSKNSLIYYSMNTIQNNYKTTKPYVRIENAVLFSKSVYVLY